MKRLLLSIVALTLAVGVLGCGGNRTAELPKGTITDTTQKPKDFTAPSIPKPPGG